LWTPAQEHLPQQEIQKIGLLGQANSDTIKIATVVQQVMPEVSEAVSEKDKIMIITERILK
jgi:hypothetical protein